MGCDVAATEGARRATGVAATSLAGSGGYPWPVVKLACFGQRSWCELKTCVKELVPRRPKRRRKANDAARCADAIACHTPPPGKRGSGFVGGGRAPAKPSSWALMAEMERYIADDDALSNRKTVRTIRT